MDTQCAIPTQLGDLQLLALLGQGTAGKVYLAEHHSDGWRVAIKVIKPQWVYSAKVVARFEAEARILSRISHPNVVRVLDFGGLPDGRLYLVMEWLDGIPLDALLSRRARYTLAEALPYVLQICAALQAAHDQGVIHRDLKPQNIIVLHGHPVRLKVVDFGVAKLLDGPDRPVSLLTTVGELLGTPLFMAPEQIESRWRVDTWTDLYALGLILYMMLGGRHPFEEEDKLHEMLVHHLVDPPPPLRRLAPDLPGAVVEVVHRCLEKDPARRPASADAVAAAFTSALDEELPLDLTDPMELQPTPEHHYRRAITVYDAKLPSKTAAAAPTSNSGSPGAPRRGARNRNSDRESPALEETQTGRVYDKDEDLVPIPRREVVCLPPPERAWWRSWALWIVLALILVSAVVVVGASMTYAL